MNRPFESVAALLLTSALSLAPLGCDSEQQRSASSESTAKSAPEAAASKPAPVNEPVPMPAPNLEPSVDEPVLASATSLTTPTIAAAPATEPPRSPKQLRSPSLLPAGTPEANVEAFTQLRLSTHDKAPIAGAGTTGVHLDEIELGKGWAASRCEEPTRSFVVDVDDRVSFCFRVVHPSEAETVTVEWSRDAKLRHSIEIDIPAKHAYLTRAWMPVTAGRVGHWSAVVKSSDGTVLGQLEFDIGK